MGCSLGKESVAPRASIMYCGLAHAGNETDIAFPHPSNKGRGYQGGRIAPHENWRGEVSRLSSGT